jgi:hypothetical protein
VGERGRAWWLLTGGVIGLILFVVVFLIEGWTRSDYDPLHMFVSLLSLTDAGWQQIANFVVSGTLIVGGAVGLRMVLRDGPGSRWGPLLIGLAGGLPGRWGDLRVRSRARIPARGAVRDPDILLAWRRALPRRRGHLLRAPAAMLVLARRFDGEGSRWALYSRASAVGVLAFFFAEFPFISLTGLFQRVSIILALGWVAQIMWRFRREAAAAG